MNRKDILTAGGRCVLTVATAALLLSACASTKNAALKESQQSYAVAAANPMITENRASAEWLAQADKTLDQGKWVEYDLMLPSTDPRPDPREVDDLAHVADGQVAMAQLTAQQAQAQQKLAQLDSANLAALRTQETKADDTLARLRTDLNQKGNDRIAALDAKLDASLARVRAMGGQAKRSGDRIEMTLSNVTFDFDKASLKPEFKQNLEIMSTALTMRYPSARLTVEGHTDSIGTKQYNQQLSDERAKAVGAFLSTHGVDAKRIITRGLGGVAPVASNDTPEGREQNRRVDLVIQGKAE